MKHPTYAVLVLLLSCFSAAAQNVSINMVSRMDGIHHLEDGSSTTIWGYGLSNAQGGSVSLPGPTLNLQQGDTVKVKFLNSSPESHTIHWHGLDVDQVNDGVPSTSFYVPQNQLADYNFVASYPGTFLYHCHVTTTLHLTMGMYGMIVVSNASAGNTLFDNGPSFAREQHFLTSDMDRSWNENVIGIGGAFHTFDADYFMVNGQSGTQLLSDSGYAMEVNAGDSVALRLGNIGYSLTRYIFPAALNAQAYMSDGRPLPNPFSADTLSIYPGERYTVLLTPTTDVVGFASVSYYHLYGETLLGMNMIPIERYVADGVASGVAVGRALDVFPNPATEHITLDYQGETARFLLMNMQGRVVQSGQVSEAQNRIDVHTLTPGHYLLRVADRVQKLVIQ